MLVFPLVLLSACSGGSSDAAPAEVRLRLAAVPAELQPGSTIELRPTFARGTARIDPGVGAVQSGQRYRVGPFASGGRFTLTVTTATGTETAFVDVPLRYRERVTTAPPSPIARTRHAAVDLADGRILLVGGSSPGPLAWTTSELFTPAATSFEPAGDLSVPRTDPVVVATADGGALCLGGSSNAATFAEATRIEQWSPGALAWSIVGQTLSNRSRFTATVLPNRSVLLFGGVATGGLPDQRDAELFEPGLGSRSPLGESVRRRAGHTATRLADGRVLLAGGFDPVTGLLLRDAEVYDHGNETFTPAGELAYARSSHAAVLLPDGTVYVIGGEGLAGGTVRNFEQFDPTTGVWRLVGSLGVGRMDVRAMLLGSDEVVLVGGTQNNRSALAEIEFLRWRDGRVRSGAAILPGPRTGHSLHVLADGRVAVLGGDVGGGIPVATAFLID
jgi:hypothetical protein